MVPVAGGILIALLILAVLAAMFSGIANSGVSAQDTLWGVVGVAALGAALWSMYRIVARLVGALPEAALDALSRVIEPALTWGGVFLVGVFALILMFWLAAGTFCLFRGIVRVFVPGVWKLSDRNVFARIFNLLVAGVSWETRALRHGSRAPHVTRADRLTREMYGALPEDKAVIECALREEGDAQSAQLARVALVCFVAVFSCGLAAVWLPLWAVLPLAMLALAGAVLTVRRWFKWLEVHQAEEDESVRYANELLRQSTREAELRSEEKMRRNAEARARHDHSIRNGGL